MRILITNDDGINAPVLPRFAEWAKQYGEVTVVAPKFEQSGNSQAIDFRRAVEIKRVDFPVDCEAWAMDSSPADCVRFGVTGLGRRYDVVFSGINHGYNLGDDISYSGTVGAIMEAARLKHRAIAFSTDIDTFDFALAEIDRVYKTICERDLFAHAKLLNVNFPPQKSRGILITKQGGEFYSDAFEYKGNDTYLQVGYPIGDAGDDLSLDIAAVRAGYVSVTPLTEERTDWVAYEKLRKL